MTPKIRFPDFIKPWEIKDLGEISEIYDGTHQTPKYTQSGIKFVSVENISDINKSEKYISKEAFEKDFKNKPKKNDILMTRITAGVIGATAIVTDDKPLAYYVSLALIRCVTDDNVNFLNQRIESRNFKHELHKRIIHVAFPKKINLGEIGKCKISLPEPKEQQKIATFLGSVDDKINKLRRKRELLTTYKLGLMQKLFSQEKRFKQDDGTDFPDWEEKRIECLYDWVGTNNLSRDKLSLETGEIQNIHYGDIHSKFTSHFDQKKEYAPHIIDYNFVRMIKSNAYCKSGDLIIADASEDYKDIGKAIEIINVKANSLVAGLHTYIARPKIKFSLGFSGYLFQSGDLRKKIQKIAQGISVLGISKTNLNKIEVCIPSIDEQQKITNSLSAFDKAIEAVSQQITQLESFKKGLLQKMFV